MKEQTRLVRYGGGNRKNDLYASGSFLQGKQKTDLRQTLLMKIAIIGHFQTLR